MAVLTINIDRTTDPEVTIISCLIDNVLIGETYYYDSTTTDETITLKVRTDLANKLYIFD